MRAISCILAFNSIVPLIFKLAPVDCTLTHMNETFINLTIIKNMVQGHNVITFCLENVTTLESKEMTNYTVLMMYIP